MSILAILGYLLAGGLGLPVPEDPALLAAGVLVYHGEIGLLPAIAICFGGVIAGDTALFLIARHLGPYALERPLLRRVLPPARQARIERMYEKHGSKVVFVARHLAGLRAAAFAFAGLHGMKLRSFVAWDALAACISVPLVVMLGYAGALQIDRVRADIKLVEHILLGVAAIAVAVFFIVRKRRIGARDAAAAPHA